MPKIDSATVAEHRAARRAALLGAAATLLRERPEATPSLADVGRLAGLSRSAVYHYFSSSQDLLTAVMADTFPRWQQRFADAYAQAATPADRVRAYVRENLALVSEGEHALARSLRSVVPDHEIAPRSAAFHSTLAEPLTAALEELGDPSPDLTTELINALVLTGARRLESGDPPEQVMDAVTRLLEPYLQGR